MLLLDSQTLLWVLDDSPRLGPAARTTISSASGVYVSAATVWELTIKSMLGKLSVPFPLPEVLTAQGFALLNITAEHADALRDYPELMRHDPFDRLLVAQADRAGLRLLTADKVLLGLQRKFIVDATREAIPMITDPAAAEEAQLYLRQEAQHSAAHLAHIRALSRRWPGLQQVVVVVAQAPVDAVLGARMRWGADPFDEPPQCVGGGHLRGLGTPARRRVDHDPLDQRQQQFVLGGKVLVEGPQGGLRALHDVQHGEVGAARLARMSRAERMKLSARDSATGELAPEPLGLAMASPEGRARCRCPRRWSTRVQLGRPGVEGWPRRAPRTTVWNPRRAAGLARWRTLTRRHLTAVCDPLCTNMNRGRRAKAE